MAGPGWLTGPTGLLAGRLLGSVAAAGSGSQYRLRWNG